MPSREDFLGVLKLLAVPWQVAFASFVYFVTPPTPVGRASNWLEDEIFKVMNLMRPVHPPNPQEWWAMFDQLSLAQRCWIFLHFSIMPEFMIARAALHAASECAQLMMQYVEFLRGMSEDEQAVFLGTVVDGLLHLCNIWGYYHREAKHRFNRVYSLLAITMDSFLTAVGDIGTLWYEFLMGHDVAGVDFDLGVRTGAEPDPRPGLDHDGRRSSSELDAGAASGAAGPDRGPSPGPALARNNLGAHSGNNDGAETGDNRAADPGHSDLLYPLYPEDILYRVGPAQVMGPTARRRRPT
ncbi:hypothetical protein BDV59DRAFT_24394 [Aspergillus ambiguus]|uniref:uncharacterized protein n=1 Tax=Aspergillus ambiguus TaxID=176160 RepID=UPI003CCCBD2D